MELVVTQDFLNAVVLLNESRENSKSMVGSTVGKIVTDNCCHELSLEGGCCDGTCAIGLLRVVKQLVKIPVRVMIRPRAGDFHYSDQEMDVMRTDIKVLKENGADGFVLGLLHRLLLTHFHCYMLGVCRSGIYATRPVPVPDDAYPYPKAKG